MEVYIVIEFFTLNELGAIGYMAECKIFKTEEEAVGYVRKQSGGKEPKRDEFGNIRLYELFYSTPFDGDKIRWYIIKREL